MRHPRPVSYIRGSRFRTAASSSPETRRSTCLTEEALVGFQGRGWVLSQITENRKVEARKSLIFHHTIFTFGLKKANLRQNGRQSSAPFWYPAPRPGRPAPPAPRPE